MTADPAARHGCVHCCNALTGITSATVKVNDTQIDRIATLFDSHTSYKERGRGVLRQKKDGSRERKRERDRGKNKWKNPRLQAAGTADANMA